MAYNFKSIADVEVVAEPTESANVLIEENGVIKKTPKTAVGGAGGEADLVIRINDHLQNATIDSITIVSGSVEAVYNTFESGKFPIVEVEVVVTPDVSSLAWIKQKIPTQVIFYGDYLYIAFMGTNIWGNMNCAYRITFDSSNNYALHDFMRTFLQIID